MTTSVPISVFCNDLDNDLLCSGIQHLPFQLFQEIKVEGKSETVYLVVVQMFMIPEHSLGTTRA